MVADPHRPLSAHRRVDRRRTRTGHGVCNRTFRLNDVTDLHSTVLAGLQSRYATPFSMRCGPMRRRRSLIHTLPSRGASIFNSKSLHDMGGFYSANIFRGRDLDNL